MGDRLLTNLRCCVEREQSGATDDFAAQVKHKAEKMRCDWVGDDPTMIAYHDEEWGVPVHDERLLFEFLSLEGAQAGLSWSTILNRRENYRTAFDNFDPDKVAGYSEDKINYLLRNTAIIRNRLKVRSVVTNARAVLGVREEFGSFSAYIWRFVGGRTIQNRWERSIDVPAKTREAEAMSKDLKRRGFKFVGPTICYAFMQAIGMVNDHTIGCYRFRELGGSSRGRSHF
ncbi:MAG TPA: DNA-3-methyladenine glycosylase I [Desulfomonilaceae bacterium]|nr:DNA-3-methyladenine glycosylase I [Desulfomonilaceae bacterium]